MSKKISKENKIKEFWEIAEKIEGERKSNRAVNALYNQAIKFLEEDDENMALKFMRNAYTMATFNQEKR